MCGAICCCFTFRCAELGEAYAEGHSSLGPFYLEYGNALLKNAENSNNLFRIQDVESSKETTKVQESTTNDEADVVVGT